jgi:uncharacterized delta-60 repeat protein
MKTKLTWILYLLINTLIANSQPGFIDYSFRTDFDCNRTGLGQPFMLPISVQKDGKIITGGNCRINFTNGNKLDNLFRLNTDGTLDTSFKVRVGPSQINFISVLSNDKILISCSVSCGGLTINGIHYPSAVVLNSDGSVDSTFHNSVFKFFDRVLSIAIIKDDIAIYGYKGTEFLLLKFKTNGTIDPIFKKSIITYGSSSSRDLFYLSDGRLIQRRTDSSNWQESLYIINSDGSLNGKFLKDKEIQLDFLTQICEQHDGKIILCGEFHTLFDSQFRSVIRINKDGSIDKSYSIPLQLKNKTLASVRSALIQGDNKLLLCGSFEGFDENNRVSLLRLNQDGSIDNSFYIKDAFNNTVLEIANYFNSKVIVSGIFDSYGTFMTSRIARVNIVDQDDFKINIFPNPNFGIFKIDVNREVNLIVITDIIGREILRFIPTNPNLEIDIHDKAKGTYFLSVYENNQIHVRKILKL